MHSAHINQQYTLSSSPLFNNVEKPFTELLGLLIAVSNCDYKKQKAFRKNKERLEAIYKHATNAFASVIWGLESFGYILALAADNKEIQDQYVTDAGYFIKTIANLLEALNGLRHEMEVELKKKKVMALKPTK